MAGSAKGTDTPLPDIELEFTDPRSYCDRRQKQLFNGEHRRKYRRRKIHYMYSDLWWLKRTYKKH